MVVTQKVYIHGWLSSISLAMFLLRNSAHLESLHGGIVEHLARGFLHLLHRLQLCLGGLDLSLDHLGGCLSQVRHVLFILIFVFARCVSEEIPK